MSERANDETFEQLAAGYFDEALDDTQLQQLKQLLAEDDRYVKRFAELSQLHQMIESEIAYQKQAQRFHLSKSPNDSGAANALAELASLYEDELQNPVNFTAWREEQASKAIIDRHRLWRKRFVITSAIAAVLALAGLLAFQFIANTPAPQTLTDNTPTQNKPAESAQPIPRDQPVATLTATHNATWARPASAGTEHPPTTGSKLQPGDALAAGQRLNLTHGFAEITTARGAIAILEAPTTIELLNDNALRLHAGKLVGICETESSKGFLVRTPHMDVTDLGTRFGVEADETKGAYAEVFEGEISLVASVGGAPIGTPVRLRDGQTARVAPYSGSVVSVRVDADRFASLREHEASRIARGEFQGAEAVRKRWQEHDELLAAVSFSSGEAIEGYGFQRIYAKNLPYTIAAQSLIPPHASQATQVPGRIVFGPGGLTNIFGEFDFSPDSALARSGLLTDDGLMIGRTSRRVCLSWVFNLEEGTPSHESWFLFSLYAGGEHHLNDVVLAMGKNNSGESWGLRHLGTDRVLSNRAYLESAGARLPIEPGQPCRWLAVIDFDDLRGDRIAIYFNPDPSKPLTPNYEANNLKLAFDRISIEAGRSQCRWSADEVRIGTTIDSVLLN